MAFHSTDLKEARNKTHKIIRETKNAWFQVKAEEYIWMKSYLEVHQRSPVHHKSQLDQMQYVMKMGINLCTSSLAQQRRWLNHFNKVWKCSIKLQSHRVSRVKQRTVS